MNLVKFGFITIIVLGSAFVSAHSNLKSSFPENGQQLREMPKVLELAFSKPVKLTQVELYHHAGEQVKLAFMLSPMLSERFEIPLPVIKHDSYKVMWRAMADDRNKMEGEFVFDFIKADSKDRHKVNHNKSGNQSFSGQNSAPGKVVSQFHHALKSGDKELARSLLVDNVLIYEGGRVERSADEYANHHMLADMKYLKNITTSVLEHIVITKGKIAFSNSRSHSTGKFRGKDIDQSGMETIILEEINAQWKIIRIHWS